MRCIEYKPGAVAELQQGLQQEGAVYVANVGGEPELLALAEGLGTLTEPGVGMPTGAHDGRVYAVEIRNGGRGITDQHRNVILSSTNLPFQLHTDGFNRQVPPRYVLLLRVDETADDTPSYVSDAQAALIDLGSGAADSLRSAIFPSARGAIPLLQVEGDGAEGLRFNQEEMERWSGRDSNPELEGRARDAVEALAECLRRRQESVTIATGDCLIVDNARVCHGRPAMAPDSRRKLLRAWVGT